MIEPVSAPAGAGKRCAFCGKRETFLRREINPPDDSTQVFKFYCSVACEANWGTNQPRPS